MAKNWMSDAVKHPGALRAKAKRRGLIKGDEPLSQKDLDVLERTGDATTKRQVALARTFKKVASRRRRKGDKRANDSSMQEFAKRVGHP